MQTISRDEINRSGAQNAMEIMNLISANNSAGNVSLSNVIGSLTFSNQTASLRGLGGQATLVLVNGKRVGTFGGAINGAEGVNLASIPFTAIDRVEVLKDGASAVYGSDAIAGVINFIMRQDFTGVEATAWAGTPTRTGGGDQYDFKATAGYRIWRRTSTTCSSLPPTTTRRTSRNGTAISRRTATTCRSASTRRRATRFRDMSPPVASAVSLSIRPVPTPTSSPTDAAASTRRSTRACSRYRTPSS